MNGVVKALYCKLVYLGMDSVELFVDRLGFDVV